MYPKIRTESKYQCDYQSDKTLQLLHKYFKIYSNIFSKFQILKCNKIRKRVTTVKFK